MEHRYIGTSGLRVSPICMGTMSFGTWSDKKESFAILDTAFDRGINFFDTAEIYPVPPTAELAGVTEEIFGEWIKTQDRDARPRPLSGDRLEPTSTAQSHGRVDARSAGHCPRGRRC